MAELVPGSPWSEVVHIEEGVGVHGGHYWSLTLSCGHHATRSRSKFRPHKIAFRKVPLAPRRVRCYVCGCLAASPQPPAPTHSSTTPDAIDTRGSAASDGARAQRKGSQ